jgi:entericidin B
VLQVTRILARITVKVTTPPGDIATMRKIILLFLLSTLLLCLAGCETFKGVGRDVQKAGNWVEDTASK